MSKSSNRIRCVVVLALIGILGGTWAAAAELTLTAMEQAPQSGRTQYALPPGGGDGALKFVDSRLPQNEVRVGASGQDGIGLGYLIAFEMTPHARIELMRGSKVELEITVLRSAMGGANAPLSLAFLDSAGRKSPDAFAQFGAWNNAPHNKPIASIPAAPAPGKLRYDVTDMLKSAPETTDQAPLVFFAIWASTGTLLSENDGRHVIFGGSGDETPKLIFSRPEMP